MEEKFENEETTSADVPADESTTPEEIPAELGGLEDDKLAREIMEEAKKAEESQQAAEPAPQASEEAKEPEVSEPVAEDQDAPGPIPYKRFKQVLDKGKSKDEEIAKLRAELEAIRNRQPQTPVQQTQQHQQPPQPQQRDMQNDGFALTPANVELINKAVNEEAMRLSQLTKEDLDSMEYMEDTDPKKQRWLYAQEFAKSNVMARIRQAQQMEMQRKQAFLAAHNASIADFNRFATEAQSAPDFEDVKSFAVNDFFKAIPSEQDKQILAAAYARIERQTASPAEISLVKNFFAQAQAEYRRQHPAAAPTNRKSQNDKFEQANSFPKSQQVNGSSDAGGGISVASLEKMLREKPFDEIDPKYQKMLLEG